MIVKLCWIRFISCLLQIGFGVAAVLIGCGVLLFGNPTSPTWHYGALMVLPVLFGIDGIMNVAEARAQLRQVQREAKEETT